MKCECGKVLTEGEWHYQTECSAHYQKLPFGEDLRESLFKMWSLAYSVEDVATRHKISVADARVYLLEMVEMKLKDFPEKLVKARIYLQSIAY